MNIKVKLKITYAIILLYNLCSGLQHAIILPTIWNYVHQRYNGSSSMLGIVIASYSLTSFFASPFVGWWSDRSHNTRLILSVTIVAEIVGSVLYFLGISKLMLVISRLVAGIGGTGSIAIIADVIHTTSSEERTSILSMVIASREIGLVIAPAFNFFLSKENYYIGSFPVDMFTSPGLFMAILWLILEFVIIFAYFNLASLKTEEDLEKLFQNFKRRNLYVPEGITYYNDLDVSSSQEIAFTSSYPPALQRSLSNASIHSLSQPNLQVEWLQDNTEYFKIHNKEEIKVIQCQNLCIDANRMAPQLLLEKQTFKDKVSNNRAGSVSDKMIESAERLIQSTSESCGNFYDVGHLQGDQQDARSRSRHTSSANPGTPCDSVPCSTPNEKTSLLGRISSENFREEVMILLCITFVSLFSHTILETILTPLAQKYYGFNEWDNSWMFLLAGFEMLLVFGVLKVLSKAFSDRLLILFGLFSLISAMALAILYLPSAVPGERTTYCYFVATIAISMVGVGFLQVCSASLLSKLTDEDNQALYQGYRRSMGNLACIMGPLWGGTFLHYTHLLFIIPLVVIVLMLVLFICSYKKLEVLNPIADSM